jgi:hypothetical protein
VRLTLAVAVFALAACSQASHEGSTASNNSSNGTPSPPGTVRFVTPDPATAKIAGSQSTANPFSGIVTFHEIGLRRGQAIDYRVNATGIINYSCFRTDGTLASAPGSDQKVSAPVRATQRFIADASGDIRGVIFVPPPPPTNSACPPGYAVSPWRSAYTGIRVTDITSNLSWQAPDMANQGE